MTNEMIKVTVEAKGLNEILNRYGIELVVNSEDCICMDFTDNNAIAIQTPSQYRRGVATMVNAIAIVQTPSQYRKGIVTIAIRGSVYKTTEKNLPIVF